MGYSVAERGDPGGEGRAWERPGNQRPSERGATEAAVVGKSEASAGGPPAPKVVLRALWRSSQPGLEQRPARLNLPSYGREEFQEAAP